MEIIVEIVGWAGMILLVSAYGMLTLGWLAADRWQYQLMNLFGGLCLATNSLYHGAVPVAVLNAVWFVIGVMGFIVARRKRNATSVSSSSMLLTE
jgi:hypothetical protein